MPRATIRHMSKPRPEPIREDEVLEVSLSVVEKDRGPMLSTIDGDQPRVRPISPLRTDGFTIYFASLRNYHKTGELEARVAFGLPVSTSHSFSFPFQPPDTSSRPSGLKATQ